MDGFIDVLTGGLSGLILTSAYLIYKIIKHARCKSSCCGYNSSIVIDLNSSETEKPFIETT